MMKSYPNNCLYCVILDDKYGKINSHWAYSTEKLKIMFRVYYDEPRYEKVLENIIIENEIDFIGFSGRLAAVVVKQLEIYFNKKSKKLSEKYRKVFKVMKLHNTNLSGTMMNFQYAKACLLDKGNDWVKLAIQHPFDLVLIQTYGDADIINKLNNNNKAVWVPYSYNDRLYYNRNKDKTLDVGAFFKLERHPHRIQFVDFVERIAYKNGYSFEFSDQYWGEQYAEKISQAKVVVHLSYCGDIPWRLYECAASRTCLLTDKLGFGIDHLFPRGSYIEYDNSFSNFESQLRHILKEEDYREQVVDVAKQSVQKYAWGKFADEWIVPIIHTYIMEKRKNVLYKS